MPAQTKQDRNRYLAQRPPPPVVSLVGSRPPEMTEQAYRRQLLAAACASNGMRADQWKEFAAYQPPINNQIEALPSFVHARNRLQRAIKEPHKVVVYGDYDCDGVSATAIMVDFLAESGLPAERRAWYIPDRFAEGYGLSRVALETCVQRHAPDLIVAVDCGSNSMAEIEALSCGEIGGRKIDTLVIDHHGMAAGAKNPAVALLNPVTEPALIELQGMCAAGLVFLFCERMAWHGEVKKWNRPRALLLAGLASYADVMPMRGLSRNLVKHAIKIAGRLNRARLDQASADSPDAQAEQPAGLEVVPGLVALHRELFQGKAPPQISERTFGFDWGPCLNAAGRLEHAALSLELLLEPAPEKCSAIAKKMAEVNRRRQALQARILTEAEHMAQAQVEDRYPARVILVASARWHLGVVGIVAARLRERFGRPALVCGQDGDGNWRGSGRSVPGFDLGQAIRQAKSLALLESGGGHPMAVGLQFTETQRPCLHRWLTEESGVTDEHLKSPIQGVLTTADSMTAGSWRELFRGLHPFGAGNPEPPLMVANARLKLAFLRVWPNSKHRPSGDAEPPVEEHYVVAGASAGETERPSDYYSALEALRKRRGFGLVLGFFQIGDNELKVSWRNVNRGLQEWRLGGHYTLRLQLYERRDGKPVFSVVDSWCHAHVAAVGDEVD